MVSFFSKSVLGIDIGVSSIKLVELSARGSKKKLENYVQFQLPGAGGSLKAFHSQEGVLFTEEVALVLKAIMKKTGIKQKKVTFSIPDFSTFFTTFSLPPMGEEEVPKAIEFEARHHIPVPLSDVNFDWQIIEKEKKLPTVRLKVLLVAVPKKVLQSYQEVAQLCGLNLKGMEAEVFGLIRAVVPKEKTPEVVCMVDIGWQSTTVSLVKKNNLVASHSFDISGSRLNKALSSGLSVSAEEAEVLKRKHGLNPNKADIFKILSEQINVLAGSIDKVCRDFSETGEQPIIESIMLVGGNSALIGLEEYLANRLQKKVQRANPFADIVTASLLQDRLKQLGPTFAVALGVSMMGFER